MQKIAIILSNINKALAFEWISEFLKHDYELHFILLFNGNSEMERYLEQNKIKVFHMNYRGKADLVKSVFKIRRILSSEKIELVHTHLLDAALAGLIAAKLAGIRKRIYTRHHATSHHVYHPHAVRYDKVINYLASDIVATSENVKRVLIEKENVPENKIHLIHHGFDLDAFAKSETDKVILLNRKYNAGNRKPVIGVIARYIELKGIQYIIPAFKRLLHDYPDALLILANASGKYKPVIRKLLKDLPAGSYIEIPFENDLVHLYQLFDVHVHVPTDEQAEAFGQTYVEALAAGIPSVFTMSGVAPEIIKDRINALVVPFKNTEAIYQALSEILENSELRTRIADQGKMDVRKLFSIHIMIRSLKELYEN